MSLSFLYIQKLLIQSGRTKPTTVQQSTKDAAADFTIVSQYYKTACTRYLHFSWESKGIPRARKMELLGTQAGKQKSNKSQQASEVGSVSKSLSQAQPDLVCGIEDSHTTFTSGSSPDSSSEEHRKHLPEYSVIHSRR